MNIIEWATYMIGRAKGQYYKGLDTAFSTSGTRPLVTDDTAFLDPYAWGSALLEGKKPKTKAGCIRMLQGWVYICAKINANAVASQTLRLYVTKSSKSQKYKTIETRALSAQKKEWLYGRSHLDSWLTKAQDVEEVTTHKFLDLMKNVNPYHNERDLEEFTTIFLDLTGEAYWLMLKDNLGVPMQIWVIPSQFINPKFGDDLEHAITSYTYRRGNIEVPIPVEAMVMFTYPNPNNLFTGFSCVQGIADAVYIQNQMNEFETALFENRARPGMIFTVKGNLVQKEKERLEQKMKQKFSGSKKAGKNLILSGDMTATRDTMTPEELSFIEGRRINREEITIGFDIPFGMFDPNANRANAEAAAYQHAKIGILPRCDRIEQKINEKVLPLFDEKLFCAFDDPVPQNRELKLKESVELVNAGIKTLNQDRAERGWEPVEGGDVPLIDSRRVPLDTLGSKPEEEQIMTFSKRVMSHIKEMLNND